MGGVAHLHGETELPLLVEWLSTEEFGAVARIDLFLGVQKDGDGRTYAPFRHGPRSDGTTEGLLTATGYDAADGLHHGLLDDDHYWHVTRTATTSLRISGGQGLEEAQCSITTLQCVGNDDSPFGTTPLLQDEDCQQVTSQDSCELCQDLEDEDVLLLCEPLGFTLPGPDFPLSEDQFYGIEAKTLDLTAFEATEDNSGDRFFVRAFAKTHRKTLDNGGCDSRLGHCITRFAYTNPVWAVTTTVAGECPADPQGIDSDGDGLPDGCDPCPHGVGDVCLGVP